MKHSNHSTNSNKTYEKSPRHKQYHGILLLFDDCEVLETLESQIGKIIPLIETSYDQLYKFGYKTEGEDPKKFTDVDLNILL
jgi:hypothetical protein